ncbi:unnamed protein product [Heligmosomoides polygyrus]|uniref:Myelin basic protein n=1 Tax=Heligmosomoides polygyrus TaxID=6339 RepID=A0A183GRP2_HELPZ|nr:unnamed protein product [Heligmosomoides polygyrus]
MDGQKHSEAANGAGPEQGTDVDDPGAEQNNGSQESNLDDIQALQPADHGQSCLFYRFTESNVSLTT